jgi:N-acetylneuraminate synthase
MAIITQVNREYCKKILVIFPGQTNPEHFHKKKEETFIVLKGELSVVLEGSAHQVGPGQVLVIPRGSKHILSSVEGCVVEEISTQHFANDSYYSDTHINANQSRKTLSSFWV